MSSHRRTVAACVFQGHPADGHHRHECPLVQALARRLLDGEIEDAPECVEREVCKYRTVARVIGCPLLAKLSRPMLITS
jgi:hypothetical protein